MEKEILFGAAYYPEYMPYERVKEDIRMMKEAGMNVVRIAESTWSTLEPEDGVFDFSYIDQVIEEAGKAGMKVIIGTPTLRGTVMALQERSGCTGRNRTGRVLLRKKADFQSPQSDLPMPRRAGYPKAGGTYGRSRTGNRIPD